MSMRNLRNQKLVTVSLIAVAVAYPADKLDSAESATKAAPITKMQNEKSRKCITAQKVGKGEYILQFDCNKPGAVNRWIRQISPEAPYFNLKVRHQNRDWCIGVDGGSPLPDAELRLFPCDGKANQKWKLDGGRIKNYDQLCIGVDNAGVEDGDVLKQFKCDNNSNQKWRLIR